jgi:hypothetical protein
MTADDIISAYGVTGLGQAAPSPPGPYPYT